MAEAKDILDPFREDFKMFIEAGFMAVHQKDETHARQAFEAASVLKPDHSAPKIGLAYIALNKLEVKKADALLTEVLEKDPENHLAQAFLGITYLLVKSKRSEGEKMLKKVMKESEDPTILNLSKVSMEWADKDLKSSQAPFFAQGKKEEEEKG